MAIEDIPLELFDECEKLYNWIEDVCFSKCQCRDCSCFNKCVEQLEEVHVDNECFELKEMGLI